MLFEDKYDERYMDVMSGYGVMAKDLFYELLVTRLVFQRKFQRIQREKMSKCGFPQRTLKGNAEIR